MRIRRHLSYANVTATIALLLAAGTGGAYAINSIGSRDIKDNSIRSQDLRDGRAVRGKDVRPNSLGGREINERALVASRFIALHGSEAGNCDPSSSAFIDCVDVQIPLKRSSRLLVMATGGLAANAPGIARSQCEIRIDGVDAPAFTQPGDLLNSSNPNAVDGFAWTDVSPSLSPGQHDVALVCNQAQGDAIISAPTIAVIAVTAGG
ncbi:MAG: hypothetical protein M3383_03375 [Actinomycetota bacterium]|nr:hypothetical protein [Actinomycetota bacterium]